MCRCVDTEFLISVTVQFLSTADPASPLTVRGSEALAPLAEWDLVAVVPSALSWRPSLGAQHPLSVTEPRAASLQLVTSASHAAVHLLNFSDLKTEERL